MTNSTNSINGLDSAQDLLIKLVEQNPDDWETRKKVVQVLYDAGFYRDASTMVWSAPEIPPVGEEVIFAARIVSRGQPTRAMRLFGTVVQKNAQHPEENLAMAKLLVKSGMPHQAIRFYGAATALDTSLVDEDFELSLVGADNDGGNWSEAVADAAFVWDGPQSMQSDGSEFELDAQADSYAELLSGATQPVPMKAPVREKVERSMKLPEWKVEKAKTTFVSKELLEKEAGTESGSSVENESRTEDAAHPTEDRLAASAETPEVNPANDREQARRSAVAAMMDFADQRNEEKGEKKVAEQGEQVAEVAELTSDAKATEEIPPRETAPVSESSKPEAEPASTGAFFKSYDDAHGYNGFREPEGDSYVAPSVPPLARPAASAPVENTTDAVANAAADTVEATADVAGEDEADAVSLAAYVADALSHCDRADEESEAEDNEGKAGTARERVAGVFSSIVNKLRPKSDEQPTGFAAEMDAFDPVTDEKPDQAEQVEIPAVPVAVASPPAEPKPVAPVSPVTAQPASTQQSVPRELDGRTQLVSLAPQDGSAFFSQLQEKYNAVSTGELPKPAVLARDLANVDYVALVGKACSKDLDAFSKLLGLHRVMSGANCGEWVEDMNLLRKGFGDAVLATVVSKYSVTECRDILNSVYAQPAPQAAAV